MRLGVFFLKLSGELKKALTGLSFDKSAFHIDHPILNSLYVLSPSLQALAGLSFGKSALHVIHRIFNSHFVLFPSSRYFLYTP